ncbi:MAG TPA: TcpE family conjugal transfer membrane protein, partial [Trebonia sp.]|nr:TcpE family conjugal transfer membrane protein [Trebonia sp.]
YKLYDFRLPMPLPINWIAVFAGITIPYIVLLIAIGLPFNHSLVWLYVLPPGLLTWLTTRPVLENKRLPELVESQARYLSEPRTWVRLAPLSEKDEIVLTAQVWRSRRPAKQAAPAPRPVPVKRPALPAAQPGRQVGTLRPERVLKPTSVFRPEPGARPQQQPEQQKQRARGQERVRGQERSRASTLGQGQGQGPARRAPALPPSRQFPTRGPVALPPDLTTPERPSRPTPAQPVPPQPAAAPRQAPAMPMPIPAPVLLPAPPATPTPGPTRVRGAASANLEVSHDAPRRRRFAKAKPAEPTRPDVPVPPDAPAQPPTPEAQPPTPPPSVRQAPASLATPATGQERDWPVPARPLRPVPSTTDDAAAAAQVDDSPAASAPVALPVPAPEATPAPASAPAASHEPAAVAPEPVAPEPAAAEAAEADAPTPATPPPVPVAAPVELPALVPVNALVEPSQPPMRREAIHVEAVLAPPVLAPVQPAPVPVAAVQEVTDPKRTAIPSIERALSGPSRSRGSAASWGGKVKIVTGNGATAGPGARDQEAQDRNRARLPIAEPRRILVLGCTSGAGQSVTALMTASMLASLREHPVAAVDLHDGTLARYRAPAAWLEELLAGMPPQAIRPTRPDGLHPTPKPSPARLDVVASHEPLRDGDEIKLAVQLNRHYPLTLLDPGAAGLTRLLKVTDQLVVVVPANVDAAGALANTRDWLDNNGHADLAMQSVTVINGVSRRSLSDVESAESIARGRSRAIVRVPWDEMLPVAAANPSTLRPQTRVAYTALAGVLVAGLAATPARKKS